MKQLKTLALAAFCLILIPRCDEVTQLADLDFPVTLSESIPVDAQDTQEYTSTIVLDATTDPDIKEYVNNIKSYEVTKLTFAIENYSSSVQGDINFSGYIGFGSKGSNQPAETCPANNIPVTVWATTNKGMFELDNCTMLSNRIGQFLKNENAVKIYMSGTFTDAPVSFDLKVTATVKVTANPL